MSKKEIDQANELTAKKAEFSEWYSQILQTAEIIDKRFRTKGMHVWLPYGYSIMNAIKRYWDKMFQDDGIKEMYFPLIVPIEYCEQNDSWWNGFKEEAFWVKGLNEKEATHVLRPTGEPAMYPMFSLWIRSYTDLPLRIYQTVSSFRYETKHTRPLIRDREITVWHEIHTAHATKEDAEKEFENHMVMYDKLWEFLALPSIKVRKPQWEVFPGAVGAVEYYSLMPTGKVMENGSVNNLGQAYAKKFNIKYKDQKGAEHVVWQLCTGNGARLLAAVIAVHGDDKGLVLPPNIAPIQAVITPIYTKKNRGTVLKEAEKIEKELAKAGIRVYTDARDVFPGIKFYDWEIKGVPLRVEIGPRDLEKKQVTLVRRDTQEKHAVGVEHITKKIPKMLEEVQNNLYTKASHELEKSIVYANNKKELVQILKEGKIAKIHWCGTPKTWDEIKAIHEGCELFGTDLKGRKGKCVITGKETDIMGYVANTY